MTPLMRVPGHHRRFDIRTVLAVIGWSLIGCVLAFVLTNAACTIHASLFAQANVDGAARGWAYFGLVMMSPWFGLALGAIYGIIRERRRRYDHSN